ncbi:MAG: hypothetical protein KatS3mg085_830 [Candidatus Dojkabacteria bacterium]|nr:MAG: hypothetical protein KatS3mg085_830 [Candidatus Dojkabacteria bacterium]
MSPELEPRISSIEPSFMIIKISSLPEKLMKILEILLSVDPYFFESINNTPTNPIALWYGLLHILQDLKIDVSRIKKIVDFGCGLGVPLAIIASVVMELQKNNENREITVRGFDIDTKAIEQAKELFNKLNNPEEELFYGLNFSFGTIIGDGFDYPDIVFCYPQQGQMSDEFMNYVKKVFEKNPNAIIIVNCFTNFFGEDYLGIELKLKTDPQNVLGREIVVNGQIIAKVIRYFPVLVQITGEAGEKGTPQAQANILILVSPNNNNYLVA